MRLPAVRRPPSAAISEFVDQAGAQLLGDALSEVAAQGDPVGEQRVAGGLEQRHVAFGLHLVGVLVVAERVREETPLAAGHLHIAGRRDHVLLGIERDLVGDQQHRPGTQIEGISGRGSDQERHDEHDGTRRSPADHGQLAST